MEKLILTDILNLGYAIWKIVFAEPLTTIYFSHNTYPYFPRDTHPGLRNYSDTTASSRCSIQIQSIKDFISLIPYFMPPSTTKYYCFATEEVYVERIDKVCIIGNKYDEIQKSVVGLGIGSVYLIEDKQKPISKLHYKRHFQKIEKLEPLDVVVFTKEPKKNLCYATQHELIELGQNFKDKFKSIEAQSLSKQESLREEGWKILKITFGEGINEITYLDQENEIMTDLNKEYVVVT